MSSTQAVVNQLRSSVNRFNTKMTEQLVVVDESTKEIEITSNRIYNKVRDFKETMKSGEETQFAKENIIRLERDEQEKLKYRASVRKIVLGVISDFDINLVRNTTIGELSDELWIKSSRFWLSYAQIAISAWILGNQELANNALSMGMRQDPVRFSLFFMLFNRRFKRFDAAIEWLKVYLKEVDPCEADISTSVVLEGYLCGVFGEDKVLEQSVRHAVDNWQIQLHGNADIDEDLKKRYHEYVALQHGSEKFKSDILEEYCENFDEFKIAYEKMSKFHTMKATLENLVNSGKQIQGDTLREKIMGLLQRLIELPDEEERALQDEKKYYELVEKCAGNLEEAEKQFNAYRANTEETQDIGHLLLDWLYSDNTTVSPTVKRFALEETKEWLWEGVNKHREDLNLKRPLMFNLHIDSWFGYVDGSNLESTERSMTETINSGKVRNAVFNSTNIALSILAVLLAFIAIPVVAANRAVGLIMFGVCAATIAILVISSFVRMKGYPARVAAAKDILKQCFDEIRRYDESYAKLDDDAENLSAFIYNFKK